MKLTVATTDDRVLTIEVRRRIGDQRDCIPTPLPRAWFARQPFSPKTLSCCVWDGSDVIPYSLAVSTALSRSELSYPSPPSLSHPQTHMFSPLISSALIYDITTMLSSLFPQIDDNDSVGTLKAILEAETGTNASGQMLLHNGNALKSSDSIADAGVKDGDLIMIALDGGAPEPRRRGARNDGISSSRANGHPMTPFLSDGTAADPEGLLAGLRSLPSSHLERLPTALREAIETNDTQQLQDSLRTMALERQKAAEEEARFLRLAEEDPFNPEVQRRLEQAIREKNVAENLATALEYNPEVFGTVVMLYVNLHVNGFPVKGFVDSGEFVFCFRLK